MKKKLGSEQADQERHPPSSRKTFHQPVRLRPLNAQADDHRVGQCDDGAEEPYKRNKFHDAGEVTTAELEKAICRPPPCKYKWRHCSRQHNRSKATSDESAAFHSDPRPRRPNSRAASSASLKGPLRRSDSKIIILSIQTFEPECLSSVTNSRTSRSNV